MMSLSALSALRERIDRWDPTVRAFNDFCWSRAEAAASAEPQQLESGEPSPIDGWTLAVKSNIAVKGMPHHGGIDAYRDCIAEEDAPIVDKLSRLGVIPLGTVNMHEGALGATTDNPFFGRTINPWRRDVTAGGSSGGSGAAVAAGFCDLALGTDTMGSVRIPSAYCGGVGFKPSFDVLPTGGLMALAPSLDHIGIHGRSVSAVRTAFDALVGGNAPSNSPGLGGLRVGVWSGEAEVSCTEEVQDGFRRVLEKLREAGAQLVPWTPADYAYGKTRRAGLLVSEVEGYKVHEEALRRRPEGFSASFRSLLEWGWSQRREKVHGAYEHLEKIREAAHSSFDRVDAVVSPTAPQTAFHFDEEIPANQADFTAWANIVRVPAIALFAGFSSGGLPLSVQLTARPNTDKQLLAYASAVEAVLGQSPLADLDRTMLPGK